MEDTDLINANKEILMHEFHRLYPVHKTKWRLLLKKHNPWHGTDNGQNAWRNTPKNKERTGASTGNEALRLIIADMQAIAASTRVKKSIKKQGLTRRAITKQ